MEMRRQQLQALHEHARLCRFVARVADMMGPDAQEGVLYVTAKRAAERDEARLAACGTVDEEQARIFLPWAAFKAGCL